MKVNIKGVKMETEEIGCHHHYQFRLFKIFFKYFELSQLCTVFENIIRWTPRHFLISDSFC